MTLDPNICSHAVTPRDHHNGASLPDDRRVAAGVLATSPGGCVRLDYEEDALGRAELALPELLDGVRLAPRRHLKRVRPEADRGPGAAS